MYNQRTPDARGAFRAGKAIFAGILPYGKRNEHRLHEKLPGRLCSMVVNKVLRAYSKSLLVGLEQALKGAAQFSR